MYGEYFNLMGFSSMPASIFTMVIVAAIWSIIWKGIALWKAARNGSKPWFIAMLVVNTVGILEILYIFLFSKKSKSSQNF